MKVQMMVNNRTEMLYTMIYFNTSKSPCLVSRPGKAGSYKQALIQQIAHAGFDPLGMRQHFPCDSNV